MEQANPNPTWSKVVAWIVLIALTLGIGWAFNEFLFNDDSSPNSDGPASKLAPVSIRAGALKDAYSTNEVHAEETYHGRPVKVTGLVTSVSKETWGTGYLVHLGDQLLTSDVVCKVPKESKEMVLSLRVGETETLQGIVGDYGSFGSVWIDNCSAVLRARSVSQTRQPRDSATLGHVDGGEIGNVGQGLNCDNLLQQQMLASPLATANADNANAVISGIQSQRPSDCPPDTWNPWVTTNTGTRSFTVSVPPTLSTDGTSGTSKAFANTPWRDNLGNIGVDFGGPPDGPQRGSPVTRPLDVGHRWMYLANQGVWYSAN